MNSRSTTQTKTSSSFSPIQTGLLQRKCNSCGQHTIAGGDCTDCQPKSGLQRKLTIGASNDPLELEADRVANQVMAMSANSVVSSAPPRIQRYTGQSTGQADMTAPDSVDSVLSSPGSPLEPGLRQDMERRFGHDFSHVRVHTGAEADRSARDVNAKAYTVGHNIVFGENRFAPETHVSQQLLAHELVHVLQQQEDNQQVQRAGMGEVRLSESCEETKGRIRTTVAYTGLDPKSKTLTEEIITEVDKRLPSERAKLLLTLETLFSTPAKAPATISTETKSSTKKAAIKEKARLVKPEEAKNTGIEERGTNDPNRAGAWVAIKGKFGGGTYYVDRRSATDIYIKASIFLYPTGTGTPDDVKQIKGMEDAIEKAASTKGYLVDINFLTVKDADTFDVEVNPSKWEDATNWSGGAPLGFAHELHHMFAFELDRYNYIEDQAQNKSMQIDQRLIWFKKEIGKPANYNDSTSIMAKAEHPNDRDVCTVVGLDMKACMDARQKAKKP